MISVREARKIIEEQTHELGTEHRRLDASLNYVLRDALWAPMDSPPFDQSAMDGYVFHYHSKGPVASYQLQGMIQAGDTQHYQVQEGCCFRIFTGAPMPHGADTVIMQEHCIVKDAEIIFQHPELRAGDNVRKKGSQVLKGHALSSEKQILTPGRIGYLATLGFTQVEVVRRPKVCILVTGKELFPPGATLQHGQIYESNSVMLLAALQEGRIQDLNIRFVDDDLLATQNILQEILDQCDVLLVTGGISVGDYDFVQTALTNCGVEKLFYKVKQKPGKPLFFGRKNATLVFALPGNPSAVMTCFYQYVVPALRKMCGLPFEIPYRQLPLVAAYQKKGELRHFLKARIEQEGVRILDGQESYKLHSFMDANSLVTLEEQNNEMKPGDLVDCIPLQRIWDGPDAS